MQESILPRELQKSRAVSDIAGRSSRAGTKTCLSGVIKPVTGKRRGWWNNTCKQYEGEFVQGKKVGVWTYYSSKNPGVRHTDIHFNL